jgi:hypothetical protein
MHRLEVNGPISQQPATTPDTTVLEAAEAMERHHSNLLLVDDGLTPIGVLTAEDILNKVLAAGQDPQLVHVADIMAMGRFDRHGKFMVEDESIAPALRGAESLHARDDDATEVLTPVLSGRCEECGVYNEELVDHEGLEMCTECAGLRSELLH